MKQLLTLLLLVTSAQLSAHAGCNHDPYSITPPNGGMLEISDNHIFVEAVAEQGQVTVYTFDHDMNPIPTSEINLKGQVRFPRNRPKPMNLEFTQAGPASFKAPITVNRVVHRYTLEIDVKHDKSTGKVQFVIENKTYAENDPVDVNVGLYE